MVIKSMTAEAYKARQSEAAFQATVIEFAEYNGWVCAHTNDSRREEDGEPDLRCWRGDRYVLAELKTEKGRKRQSQKLWRWRAEQREITVHLWRPSSWPVITTVLERVVSEIQAPTRDASRKKAVCPDHAHDASS